MHPRAIIILLILAALAPSTALAHRLSIYAHAQDGQINAEGYYYDGKPCSACTIEIFQADSTMLTNGVTDDNGIFSTPAGPASGILSLVLTDAGGHRAEQTLALKAQPAQAPPAPTSGTPPSGPEPLDTASPQPPMPTPHTQAITPNTDISQQIDSALEKRLRPVQEELRRIRIASEKPGLTEILGGIGYILGLFGIWAFTKSRKGV